MSPPKCSNKSYETILLNILLIVLESNTVLKSIGIYIMVCFFTFFTPATAMTRTCYVHGRRKQMTVSGKQKYVLGIGGVREGGQKLTERPRGY